jgi:hypothetical protein
LLLYPPHLTYQSQSICTSSSNPHFSFRVCSTCAQQQSITVEDGQLKVPVWKFIIQGSSSAMMQAHVYSHQQQFPHQDSGGTGPAGAWSHHQHPHQQHQQHQGGGQHQGHGQGRNSAQSQGHIDGPPQSLRESHALGSQQQQGQSATSGQQQQQQQHPYALGMANPSTASFGGTIGGSNDQKSLAAGVGGAFDMNDGVSEENRRILRWIADLMVAETREAALLELSKKREQVPELALILWHSFGKSLSSSLGKPRRLTNVLLL